MVLREVGRLPLALVAAGAGPATASTSAPVEHTHVAVLAGAR